MASKIQSGNEAVTQYEIRDTDAVKSELTVEATAAPEKEAEPVADHSTVTILEKAKTGPGGASLGPIRPVVVNTPGVRRALTGGGRGRGRQGRGRGPGRFSNKSHHPMTPENSAGPSGTFYPRHYDTTPGFFPTGIDHALTGPSMDHAYLQKNLPPPSPCYIRQPMSPSPHITGTPSGMESINEPKRYRSCWTYITIKTFLVACINEIAINGCEGGSLKAMSWNKVGEVLKASHNFSVDSKQMKDYFDGLKSKYKAWVTLKSKTGNKYNPSTNMFNLTDKEWETEIKKNKCIEELRKAPLLFPDLCSQLFEGGIDQTLTEPGLTHPTLALHHVAASPSGKASLEPQAADALVPPSAPPLPATETPAESQKEAIVEVPSELPKVLPAKELVPIETKRSMSVFEEELLGVLKVIADRMNKPEPPPKPTFEDCEKKLNELGWANDDPLHLVALTIFCDENDNYRELWMKLNKNLCADWLRMIGRGKRFT